jgi:hypothetical protein
MVGTSALVCCPVNPLGGFEANPGLYTMTCEVSADFQPVGLPTTVVKTCTVTEGKIDAFQYGQLTISVDANSMSIDRCDSCTYCFGIADQLYAGLKSRYTGMTLTFPTQVLNIASMSNLLQGETPKSSQTIAPRFIDTIFLLFPLTSKHRTVYRNPVFTQWYLTAGGFGQYPDIPYGTEREARLVELVQNAVNLNGNNVSIFFSIF